MKLFLSKALKRLAFIGLCICILAVVACTAMSDRVIVSLGNYEKREFYTSGGFQDFTDYAKYYYSSARAAENEYLKRIQETDMSTINRHLDDFDSWVEAVRKSDASNELVAHFDFSREIIDTEDYFYIVSEERTLDDDYTMLVKYNMYLFDTQTQILYYFHNNI